MILTFSCDSQVCSVSPLNVIIGIHETIEFFHTLKAHRTQGSTFKMSKNISLKYDHMYYLRCKKWLKKHFYQVILALLFGKGNAPLYELQQHETEESVFIVNCYTNCTA